MNRSEPGLSRSVETRVPWVTTLRPAANGEFEIRPRWVPSLDGRDCIDQMLLANE